MTPRTPGIRCSALSTEVHRSTHMGPWEVSFVFPMWRISLGVLCALAVENFGLGSTASLYQCVIATRTAGEGPASPPNCARSSTRKDCQYPTQYPGRSQDPHRQCKGREKRQTHERTHLGGSRPTPAREPGAQDRPLLSRVDPAKGGYPGQVMTELPIPVRQYTFQV